ncbi:MAG: Ig-like domain-containing protein [Porphyromonas sp.]|uniref:Ig-like domain-containing protein n=1 Tax=Porphyromonas sp. TaxID=1924944 RepID=UPI002A758F74|nr:Ig-like domain-containing protein [Porphyromonas sp.]MDD6927992.1 Ig-like domain-containing protein [Bacteroidales bacterium]MDY3112536.1 Ig-like domain-containing protein [Porphyromonas sp.]
MTKKILLALAALTALTLCFSSCKKDEPKPTPKSEVKLRVEPKEIKVIVGRTAELTVTVEPADTKCTFETANADIATVSDKGVITGVKVGKTVITVKAGDATPKTVDVEVIEASSMDKSRYIGTPDDKGYIAPIYVVEASKIKDLKDVITEANKVNGYVFDEDFAMDNGGNVLIYVGPNNGKQWTDDRIIGEIGYYYFPNPADNFMLFFMKNSFDEDLVKKAADGDEKAQQALFGVAAAYGFDKEQASGSLDNGSPCLVAYNMEQFPEGPYEVMILSSKNSKTGKYTIRFQVLQRAPQAQSSLAQRTPMMPEMNVAPSHLLISNR